MGDLKLGKLPDRTPIKMTIALLPDLAERLALYATLYRETYGREEAVSELVPAMLSSFLDGDRVFIQASKRGASAEPRAGTP